MAFNKINLRQIEPITGIGDSSNNELVAKIKYDILTVTGTEETPQTVFNLTATPNDTLVKLNVNGVDYFENICFIYACEKLHLSAISATDRFSYMFSFITFIIFL